jgi:hypothetical protein
MLILCVPHGSDGLLGGIGKIIGGDDGEARFGQDFLAEFDIGALKPDHQGHF